MKSNELLRKLKQAGWYEVRQKGSHIIMGNNNFDFTITVPYHASKEVPTGTLNQILKEAKLK